MSAFNPDPHQPAFPRDHAHDGHNGMSLRDYFAAKALQGLVVGAVNVDDGMPPTPESIALARTYADASYLLADAMLKAREA
jgi:hypothetical protein